MVPVSATTFIATAVFLSTEEQLPVQYLTGIAEDLKSISDSFIYVSSSEVPINGWKYIRQQTNQSPLEALLEASKANLDLNGDVLVIDNGATISSSDAHEVLTILNLAEKHGVVGVRSSLPGQGQIPTRRPYPAERLLPSELFQHISNFIPRYTAVKWVESPVIGLSNKALQAVSARDSELSTVGSWEKLCQVANVVGYSAIQSNQVFIDVAPYETAMSRLSASEVLSINGADQFAAVLQSNNAVPHSLFIDLFNLDPLWNGTSRNALSFLNSLQKRQTQFPNFPAVVIGADDAARRFFKLEQFGFQIRNNSELKGHVFDAGFALAPMTHPRQLFRMNQLCARWILSHLDIIALRTLALSETDPTLFTTVRDSMIYSDRIIAISNFSKNDLLAYFPELASEIAPRIRVCLEGADSELLIHQLEDSGLKSALVFPESHQDGYLLIMGNTYPHKQLDLALSALGKLELPIVVLGRTIEEHPKVIGFASGSLSEQSIAELFSSARVVIFPSAYEGYGLPVADAALFGKPIALFDTEIAREVTTSMGAENQTVFFSDFRDLSDIVSELYANSLSGRKETALRTLEDFNNDVVDEVLDSLHQEVDLALLNRRFEYVSSLEAYTASTRLQAVKPKTTFLMKIKAPIKKILGR